MAGHPLPAELVEACGEAGRIPGLEVVADAHQTDLPVLDRGVLAMVGKGKVDAGTPPAPARAMQTTREDNDYVKERARR